MKWLRSSDDLGSYEKNASKEWSQDQNRSSRSNSSCGFHYKPSSVSDSNARNKSNLISSSSRYDRDQSVADEDNGRDRMVRKRVEHDFESFDRRKLEFNRYRESGSSGSGSLRRSESFRGPRRDFPKGFRSERDRNQCENGSSWQSFGFNENRGSSSKVQLREVRDVKSSSWSRDSLVAGRVVGKAREREEMRRRRSSKSKSRSPTRSRNSSSEQSKSVDAGGGEVKKTQEALVESETSSEMEEGEFDPEPQAKRQHELDPEPQHELDTEHQAEPQRELATEHQAERQPELATEQAERHPELATEHQVVPQRELATEPPAEPQPELATEPPAEPQHELVTKPQHELATETQVEPQHELATKPQSEPQHEMATESGVRSDGKECCHKETENVGGEINSKVEVVKDVPKERGNEEKGEGKADDELQYCGMSLNDGTSGNEDNMDDVDGDDVEMQEVVKLDGKCEEDSNNHAVEHMLSCMEERCNEDKRFDLERQVEECEVENFIKGVAEGNVEHKININVVKIGLSCNFKDKGKGVAVESANVTDSAKNEVWTERESKDEDLDQEGPSTKGFELFSCSPVRRVEKEEKSGADKQKEDKLALESLDLSLSLPNVLLPIGAQNTDAVPGSSSQGRSVQSLLNTFCTNSDGFTASMSFSGSLSFYHNPSCSLTQNSLDNNEQSVHSRPIVQGADQLSQGSWQSQNESRQKDVPMFQRILRNGNESFGQSSALQGITNCRAVQAQNIHSFEGSSKAPNGPERQLSFHKQNDFRSPSQSVRSHQNGSFYSYDKKQATREKRGGSLYRSSSQKQQQLLIGGADFVETILSRMVFEPIHVMARKCHEMSGQSIACLKESIREIMLNAGKRGELLAFQEALLSRSDLTLEMLLKCHRAQLEILAALKTGLPEYLQVDNSVSSSDLAEVFLNLRCSNLTCRSSLPVDECDCKVCSKKNGFCSACMCLVCSKFDMTSNTCCWVGCDVCLHWCHVDCGLRESYIRNGHGASEMQFHCVACDHPSEMFGFVKEVFQNFAKDWSLETFSMELEYVKRIFRGSKDIRGRQLHELADQMLVRLVNKSDLPEVYAQIMSLLSDSRSFKPDNASVSSGKEQGKGINGISGPSQDASRFKSVYSDKAPQVESSSSLLPSFHVNITDRHDKCSLEPELQRSAQKELFLPELDSFVRIKQEEAKMYQTRADDARREAEGLKRIAIAKDEKIEEEYRSRVAKLRLAEAEETHKQKIEEFQSLERSYREYCSMKTRMEADVKHLLLKMEATRRNLGM